MKKKNSSYIGRLRLVGFLFLLPAGLLILFLTVIPFAWNIYLSLGSWDGMGSYKFLGLDNYLKIFHTRVAILAIKNSCIIALVATVVSMLLGLAMALMIYRISKLGSAVCRFLFYGPAMLPMTVVGLLFTFILSTDQGLLNGMLRTVGMDSLTHAWLAEDTVVVVTIGVVQGWRSAGTIMMLIYTALMALPSDLFEASRLEGASYRQEIGMIIMPLVRPTLVLSFSMMSMWSFKTYDIVVAMTDGGPGDLSITAPLYIIQQTFLSGKFGFASAVSILFAALIMAIIMLIRFGLRGETHEF